MKQLVSDAIVLGRTDYGEADRILTLLTPEYGKLSLLAKGVRRVKSKLAGGIELFSVSTITFIQGRGSVGTLVSTRLEKHYGHIVEDLERTMIGYELIKELNKHTEEEPGAEYFELLKESFEALNTAAVGPALVRCWFTSQLLRLGGRAPNLRTDTAGGKLDPNGTYSFSVDHMAFASDPDGPFRANHIKFLRLLFDGHRPGRLVAVQDSEALARSCGVLLAHIWRNL